MLSKSIVLDLGANVGGFSLEMARRNPDLRVYAIEADPELATQLNDSAHNLNLNNHIACNFAVSEEEGVANFHISRKGDWGTSSLLEFNREHIDKDSYWASRSDLMHASVIQVVTRRLDTFLDTVDYDEIKFLKIDVQGFDLIALKSLGAHIRRVQAGMMEVSGVKQTSLYKGEDADLRTVLNFLENNGLVPYSIKPNDYGGKEYNVFFHNLNVDIKALENELSIKNLTFYDGKDFWHCPSNKLEDIDEQIHNLKTERDRLQLAFNRLSSKPAVRLLLWGNKWKLKIVGFIREFYFGK